MITPRRTPKYLSPAASIASTAGALSYLLSGTPVPSPAQVMRAGRNIMRNMRTGVGKPVGVRPLLQRMRQKKKTSKIQTLRNPLVSPSYAGTSKSVGKFRRGKSVKKYNRRAVVSSAKGGMNLTIETRGTHTGVDTVTIGHATYPRYQVYESALVAMMVKLFDDMGVQFDGEATQLMPLSDGDQIEVGYKINSTSGTVSATFTTAVGGNTLYDFVAWFVAAARPWYNQSDYEFQWIRASRALAKDAFQLNLQKLLIQTTVKTSLKIQNRSLGEIVGETGDASAVDNVPLYGKSYSGRGNGLNRRNDASAVALVGDQQYGLIKPAQWIQEPPQPREFTNVKYVGKAHLDPGYIKTSVLQDTFRKYFNTIFKDLYPNQTSATSLVQQKLKPQGSYRVFVVEKMIDSGSAAGISIAYENNMELSCKAIKKKTVGLVKEFRKVTI